MRVRARTAIFVCVSAAMLKACGDGAADPDRPARLERPGARPAERLDAQARRRDRLVLTVETGTCEPASSLEIEERLRRIDVSEEPDAIILSVLMAPEPGGDDDCGGQGYEFNRTVRLASPIGDRGIVVKSDAHGAAIVTRPPNPGKAARLHRRFPKDISQETM